MGGCRPPANLLCLSGAAARNACARRSVLRCCEAATLLRSLPQWNLASSWQWTGHPKGVTARSGSPLEEKMQSQFYWVGSGFVILLGILFSASYSRTAFDQPINVFDIATPPRYLARRRPFFLGRVAFVGFCLAAYAFALVFHREIPALIQFAPSIVQSALADLVKAVSDDTHRSGLITVVVITIGFAYFVKNDFPGNVIYNFRSLVYSSIAVPFACKRTCEQLQHRLNVPQEQREAQMEDTSLHIGADYFGLPVNDVKRQWAEVAYLKQWIASQKAVFPGCEIFSDPNFNSAKAHNQFIALRELMGLYGSEPGDADSLAAMTELLEDLRSHHARYVACLLLTQANNRLQFYDACRKLGIDPGTPEPSNPMVYSALYVITLAVAIVLGPYLSAVAYDIVSDADSTIHHEPFISTKLRPTYKSSKFFCLIGYMVRKSTITPMRPRR